jgi:hypothetical protein
MVIIVGPGHLSRDLDGSGWFNGNLGSLGLGAGGSAYLRK